MIIETVSLAPSRDRFKVFIIDEVHMLSTSSFNALLKTLEEPPAHVVFVLATTELAKIPATIVSRCQRFRFRPIPRDVTAAYLGKLAKTEKIKIAKDALDLIAGAGGGSLRDAVSLLDQAAAFSDGNVTRDAVGELMGTLPEDFQKGLIGAVLAKDPKALTALLQDAAKEGFDPTQLLRDLRDRFQALYLYRLGVDTPLSEAWKKIAGEHSPEEFSFLLKRVNGTMKELRGSDSPQLAFELGVYGMLESAYDLREWVQRLEALERRLSGGAPAPAASVAVAAPRREPAAVPASVEKPAAKSAAKPSVKPAAKVSSKSAVAAKDVWSSVLSRLDEEKPSLAGSLEGSRLEPDDGAEWSLYFSSAFGLERVQNHKATVEKYLSEVAGKTIRLSLSVSKEKAPAAGDSKSEEDWDGASGEGSGKADPALKKVLGAFSGSKVKRVTKKKSG
jgi:DNA polymerase-3 subunit gamma/tau